MNRLVYVVVLYYVVGTSIAYTRLYVMAVWLAKDLGHLLICDHLLRPGCPVSLQVLNRGWVLWVVFVCNLWM